MYFTAHTGKQVYVFLEHQLPGCFPISLQECLLTSIKMLFLKYRHWIILPAIGIVVFGEDDGPGSWLTAGR